MTTVQDTGLDLLAQLVEPIWRTIPGPAEVVLHDLAKLPNSVIAIAGNVTGRSVGDPATDLLLESAASGHLKSEIGYASHLPDGTKLRSSTVILRDVDDVPFAAFCINVNIEAWESARAAFDALASAFGSNVSVQAPASETPQMPNTRRSAETFPRNIDDLATSLVARAIDRVGVPVDLMKKAHKLRVVEDLEQRGYFAIKESVESLAEALGVTRFTIYNYLNELKERG